MWRGLAGDGARATGKDQAVPVPPRLGEGCVRGTLAVPKRRRGQLAPSPPCPPAAPCLRRAQPRRLAGPGVPPLDPQLWGGGGSGGTWPSGAGGSRRVRPTAAPLGKPQHRHGRGAPICACVPGGVSPPQPPEATPPAGHRHGQHHPERSTPGLHLPAAEAQPGTSPNRQLWVPGTPVLAAPGSGPGLAPGGQWRCRRQPR